MSTNKYYRVEYIDIDATTKSAIVSGHGMQQAIHRFFDDYTPIMEVLLVVRQ